jgi:hypothetical protein
LVILGGDTPSATGQAGEATSSLEKTCAEEHVDQALNVIEWTVAPVPHDTDNALLRNPRRWMASDRRKCFGKSSYPYCG